MTKPKPPIFMETTKLTYINGILYTTRPDKKTNRNIISWIRKQKWITLTKEDLKYSVY
jgi:hypothetical protein